MLSKYFSDEPVNKGRQIEVDMQKAFCIFIMIFIHILEDLHTNPSGLVYWFFDYATVFVGAASFMICMGIGMRYSRRQDPKDYFSRGVMILTVGQLLNIFRDFLPNLIAYFSTGDKGFLPDAFHILQADILTFAGLAFILVGLLKAMKIPDLWMMIFGFLLNIVNYMICYQGLLSPNEFLVRQLVGFFFTNQAESYFSLGAYFVFVTVGYLIGGLYPRIKDKNALFSRAFVICFPLAIILYTLRMIFDILGLPDVDSGEQYVLSPGPDALATTLVSLTMIIFFYRISLIIGDRMPKIIPHMSAHINEYYCISYMFTLPVAVILSALGLPYMSGTLAPVLYGTFVIVACYFIIELNDKYFNIHVSNLRGKRKTIVYIAIWIVTIIAVAYVYPQLTEYSTFWNNYLAE